MWKRRGRKSASNHPAQGVVQDLEYLQSWILIVCAVAFTACVVAGLLIIFERWTPADPKTRTYLVSGVLASAVAAVTPGVGGLWTTIVADETATPTPAPTTTPAESAVPAPSPTETPALSIPDPSPTAEDRVQRSELCVPPQPSDLAEAAVVLGPRPDINCARNAPYPQCVDEILGRARGETVPSEGRDCSIAVQLWQSRFIATVYQVKAGYEPALESLELSSRPRAGDPPSELHEYASAEMKRLLGPNWNVHVELDKKSSHDMNYCYNHLCRAPED